jgi:hypothetical protein
MMPQILSHFSRSQSSGIRRNAMGCPGRRSDAILVSMCCSKRCLDNVMPKFLLELSSPVILISCCLCQLDDMGRNFSQVLLHRLPDQPPDIQVPVATSPEKRDSLAILLNPTIPQVPTPLQPTILAFPLYRLLNPFFLWGLGDAPGCGMRPISVLRHDARPDAGNMVGKKPGFELGPRPPARPHTLILEDARLPARNRVRNIRQSEMTPKMKCQLMIRYDHNPSISQ